MQNKSAGFSLPEVILVISVLAIVAGMAFPDMASFFARQRVEQERTELEQIKKAMDVYARQCGTLPARTGNPTDCRVPGVGNLNWAEALASVSNMSANEMLRDAWGTGRRYTSLQGPAVNFLGGSGAIQFNYASVQSVGPNRCDNILDAACTANYDAALGDWINVNVPDWSTVQGYGEFVAGGDDMIVKFTDNQIKAAAYEETLRRLERIIAGLDRYAQAKFNEAVVTGSEGDCLGDMIFYPPSSDTGWNGAAFSGNCPTVSNYFTAHAQPVKDDVTTVTGGAEFLDTDLEDDAARLVGMQALMRLLGLPLDHCCSALNEEPFFYFSSPGVSGSGCTYATQPPYFPPKVTVTYDAGVDCR